MRQETRPSRVVAAFAVVLAVAVPITLLANWGRLRTIMPDPYISGVTRTRVTSFGAEVFPAWFRSGLLAVCLVIAVLGLVLLVRALPRSVLLLCAVALGAVIAGIVIETNRPALFRAAPGADATVRWHLATATVVAALALAGAGLLLWLVLFLRSLMRKVCPDCAERISRRAVDCPVCGYEFPLPVGLKRCEQCHRPVKAEARVCRHRQHRFGETMASAANVGQAV